MELEAQLAILEEEKEKLQADLKVTQSSLDDLQMQNALLQDARRLSREYFEGSTGGSS